jgi:hypothetical protein
MANIRRWRRINKPKFDYELKGSCDPVVGVATLFSRCNNGDKNDLRYVICANLPYYAHWDTYDEPPMLLADAKKLARAWVKENERPNAQSHRDAQGSLRGEGEAT